MKITGTEEELARFKQACIRVVVEGRPEQLDFEAVVPIPPDMIDDEGRVPRDWVCEHWGTKWNADDFHMKDSLGCIEMHFDTAWSPPVPIYTRLAEMFPGLEAEIEGYEVNMEFAFKGTIRNGRLEIWDVPFTLSVTDPKTGETISGTREEIEKLISL
jgi:hypothetical protein